MSYLNGSGKSVAISAIKRNLRVLNSVVLLIVFTLFFLNIRFLYNILDYVSSPSVAAILTIISGLVILSLYLSRTISRNAIHELEEYDAQLNMALNTMEEEIEERKVVEKVLEHQMHYDGLTGLPNRTLFTKRLKRISKRPERHHGYLFAVLLIDLDGFKVVNDSLGHGAGDELIIAVARKLEACIRPVDTLARFGGDEFSILLDDLSDVSDVLLVIARIEKLFETPFHIGGQNVFTSASIGIVLNTAAYDGEEDFLRDADIAMYHAKLNGRARFEMFDTTMYDSIIKRVKMEADLRKAVKGNELRLHYQPIVSAADRRIIGVEALVRWEHPEDGMISPNDFIPLAEDTGLISEIGEWVLRKACEQNKAWHDSGYSDLRVEVNFSARQFQNQDVSKLVRDVLNETRMNAGCLDVEITETTAMEDQSIEILNELSSMGIGTSIDDFGTGYSSLGALKRFPIKALKIDKSFIQEVTMDTDIDAIVRAIIAMAHTLKIKVVAEGVETEEQLAFLQLHQCDEIQGYLFSPAVSESELTRMLANEECASL